MTDVGRMSVQELLGKVLADEHADVLRQAVCWLAQELMEAEVSQRTGAGYGERSGDRIELAIPQAQDGVVPPQLLGAAPPQRAGAGRRRPGGLRERRLHSQSRPAGRGPWAGRGVQGHRFAVCQGLDEQVTGFRERPLEGAYP
jgi:hypothetical protein